MRHQYITNMSAAKLLIIVALFTYILAKQNEIVCPSNDVGYSKKLTYQEKEGKGPTKVRSEFIRVKVDSVDGYQHILFENNKQQLLLENGAGTSQAGTFIYEWEDVFTCKCHKYENAEYESDCFEGYEQSSEGGVHVLVSQSNSTADGVLYENHGFLKFSVDGRFPGDPIYMQLINKVVSTKLSTKEFIKSSYIVGEYSDLHRLSARERELFKIPSFCPKIQECSK
ncbi:hypothetical protein AKO1_007093 [Acrasis kona]|uniref:Uncharacterized protein n=1 Tax=Acrasis kona TaxID=1008807 RepID=A0AAW2YTZ1_9EUKA